MNIDLLSKMVRELILDNDTVTLPGLGTFVAEMVPAGFSDKGFTINPPYRKLYFRENYESEDDRLVSLYAESNDVPKDVAERVIGEFVGEVKELLNSRKNVVFPELGRLRATKENNYFFVPFENLDIYPDGIGLEPVSLKVHTASASEPIDIFAVEPVSEALAVETVDTEAPAEPVTEPAEGKSANSEESGEEKSASEPIDIFGIEPLPHTLAVEPATEPATEPAAEVPVAESAAEPAAEVPIIEPATEIPAVEPVEKVEEETGKKSRGSKGGRITLWILIIIICVAIIAFLLFLILSHYAPDFIDKILYTKEELEIINYQIPEI